MLRRQCQVTICGVLCTSSYSEILLIAFNYVALFSTLKQTHCADIIIRGRTAFQRFASTDAKHYVFCVSDTKNA